MRALISLHDLMPETMPQCESILTHLAALELPPVPLLVVPGKDWSAGQLETLKSLADRGHELVAHGWRHQTTPRKLNHKLHALLISRDVAEHLDLDSHGILELLQRSHAWFARNGLPTPETYVPPAWALGPISSEDLACAPFSRIEVTRGVRFPKEGNRLTALPLTGYEADTAPRAFALRAWNAIQCRSARRTRRILRISLHPSDLQLRVADQIKKHLAGVCECLGYRDIH